MAYTLSPLQIGSSLFETILKILAVSVLIDKRERDRELLEFTHCATEHSRQLHPDIMIDPDQIRAWYIDHKDALNVKLLGPDAATFKENLLGQIVDRGVQRAVLASIYAIAIADYELHDEECGFIKTALRVWGSKLPDPTEIGAIV